MDSHSGHVRSRRHRIVKKPGFNQLAWAQEAGSQSGNRRRKAACTLEQVKEHNNLKKDGWMIIKGHVYSVSKYAPYHPGGFYDLARAIGDDGTDLYDEVHHYVKASSMLRGFEIGPLKEYKGGPSDNTTYLTRRMHEHWKIAKLVASKDLNPSVKVLSFEFNNKNDIEVLRKLESVLPWHCTLRKRKGNSYISRPFSPLVVDMPSSFTPIKGLDPNLLHIVVKFYQRGRMSQILSQATEMQVAFTSSHLSFSGNSMHVDGMRGRRKAQGVFTSLAFIVAGTGILPVLQILQYYFKNPEILDSVRIWLVYSNVSEEDIIFHDWLKEMAADNSNNFTLSFILSKPQNPKTWEGYHGVFDLAFLQENPSSLPRIPAEDNQDTRIVLCGPPGYEDYGALDNDKQTSIKSILLKAGFDGKYIESL